MVNENLYEKNLANEAFDKNLKVAKTEEQIIELLVREVRQLRYELYLHGERAYPGGI